VTFVALAVAIFIGLAVAALVTDPTVWPEESALLSLAAAHHDAEATPPVTYLNATYPLYAALLTLVGGLAWSGLWVFRFLSLASAVVALLLLHRLLRATWGDFAAWAATAFLAMDPLFVWWAPRVQPFTLALALWLVVLHGYAAGRRPARLAGWGLALVALTPLATLLLLPILVHRAIQKDDRRRLGFALVALAWIALAAALHFGGRVLHGAGTGDLSPFDAASPLASSGWLDAVRALFLGATSAVLRSTDSLWSPLLSIVAFVKVALLFVAVTAGLSWPDRTQRGSLIIALASVGLGVLTARLAAGGQWGSTPAALLLALGPLAFLIAAGAHCLPAKPARYAAAVVLAALLAAALIHGWTARAAQATWRETAALLANVAAPNGLVIVAPRESALAVGAVIPGAAPTSFFHGGIFRARDGLAGFQWLAVPADAGIESTAVETTLNEPDFRRGRFAVIGESLSSRLESRFATLDRSGPVRVFFRGEKALLDSKLSEAQIIDTVATVRLPDPAPSAGIVLSDNRLRDSYGHLHTQLDEWAGGIPFFSMAKSPQGVIRRHANWDWCDISSRYALAMIHIGRALGEPINTDGFQRLHRTILTTIKRDGLAYRPDSEFSDVEADVFDQGSVLLFFIEVYRVSGDARYRELIDGIIDALLAKTVPTTHGRRFPHATLLPDGTRGIGRDNWPSPDPCHHGGRLLDPLARYLQLHPDAAKARALADAIEGFVRRDSGVFAPDGSFAGHTHSRTATLLGLLQLARQRNDAETVAFVRRSVDWLIAATPPEGWIPEFMPPLGRPDPRSKRAETDALADLLMILLDLARDNPAYWDTIERYAENGLRQAQFALPRDASPDDARRLRPLIGTFCGFCPRGGFGDATQNCCTPAGAMALIAVERARADRRGAAPAKR
jgi:hypothetical protein